MVITGGKEGWGRKKRGKEGSVEMEGGLTGEGEHTIQYTGAVLYNGTPETYIILSINVSPMKSMKILKCLMII